MKEIIQIAAAIALLITSTMAYGLPDIFPKNIVVSPSSIGANGTVTVSKTITNQGNGSAEATTTRLRINSSSSGTVVGDTVLADIATPTLAAGGTVNLSTNVNVGSTTGTRYVWVLTDNLGVITQSDSGNDIQHSTALTVVNGGLLTDASVGDGVFGFILNGPVGSNYVIQVSSNLVNWTVLLTNAIPANGVCAIAFPIQTDEPMQFYRALPFLSGPLVRQPGPIDGKDIWTTSYYSYTECAGAGTGGGLNDTQLRVGGWGDEYDSLLQFDFSGMPTNVSSAELHLYCFQLFGDGTPLYLDRITQAWDWRTQGAGCDQERLWWADKPTALQWTASQLPTPTVGQWYAVDITDLYNAWQDGTYPNYGLQFRPVLNNNNNFNNFYSSDFLGDHTLRPKLVIRK